MWTTDHPTLRATKSGWNGRSSSGEGERGGWSDTGQPGIESRWNPRRHGPRRTELEGHRCSPWRLQRRVILGRVGGVSPLLFPVGRCRPMARGIELRAVPRPHPGLIGLVSACSCEGSPFHRIRRRRPGRFPGRPGIYPHHSHGPAAVSFLFQSSGSLPVASSTRISGWRGDFPRCGCPMAALSLPARPWLTSGYLSLASRGPGSGAG